MNRLKFLAIFTASVVIVNSFIGCASFKNKKNKLKDTSPITFTLYNSELTSDIAFDDDVSKKITELTGVTLKIIGNDDGFSKPIDLMIAKEDYPDLIYAKGDTSKLIDARAIIKLDDYIDKEGDNMKALYGDQLNRLRYTNEDPSIYTCGTYGVSSAQWDPEGTMQMQYRVLKELGYPKINTLDDYEKAIKEFIAKNPETYGQKTIGMTLMASDWRWLTTVGNVASKVAGIPDDGQFKVDDDTQEAVYKFEIPEVKEYFKWLNHMHAEGLLDPESFTQDEKTYRQKLRDGRVLAITDSKWDYNDAMKDLLSQGKDEYTFAPLSVTLNKNCIDQSLKDYGYSGGWGVAISKSCKDPERAFQFINWLSSDEAQVLLNWGIEGEHYKVENGKRVLLPEVQKRKNSDSSFVNDTGLTKYCEPFPQRGNGAKDSTGNYYTTNSAENYIENYNSAEKETLAAYGAKSWPELFPSADSLGRSKHGQVWNYSIASDSDAAIIQAKADSYIQGAVTKAVVGPESDFDSAWEKIQQDLKDMGISTLNKDISELTKEKVELWNN